MTQIGVPMSRIRSKSRREAVVFSNRRLPVSSWAPSLVSLAVLRGRSNGGRPRFSSPVLNLEDRRFFHPEGVNAPVRSVFKSDSRLVVRDRGNARGASSYRGYLPSAVVAFAQPSRVAVCVRRQQRREVLFAFQKSGKVGQRSPRWSEYSSISCRR